VSELRETTEDDHVVIVAARPRELGSSAASVTLLFENGHPCSVPPFRLKDIDAVTLGRAAKSRTSRLMPAGGERRLVIEVTDKRISLVHAHLRVVGEGWCLEDVGSKNGTRVNGVEVSRAILRSGDLFELGHSFFAFRGDGGDDSLALPSDIPAGLATANAFLARQFERLVKVSRSHVAVLVQGETGTGKELVAKAIHQVSGRRGPLRAVNCGALPRSLLESELFGFRKGAFSGAGEDRIGLVRSADKGTLFLDEIGDLPLDAQAAILRVLQEGEIHPIGASNPIPVDVRVVAATHRDLATMVQRGRFREDLLARLNGFSLTLPPLRERREDLGALVEILIRRLAPERGGSIAFSPAAVRALHAYQWPGNIRELEKAMDAALVLSGGNVIDLEHLPEPVRLGPSKSAAIQAREGGAPGALKQALEDVLDRHRGNVTATAAEMRTSRMQVHRLCRRFGIDLRQYRSHAP
jgi:transcriptional regulator with AAA-type ATPase domain